jgi:hypothetical protein
MKTCKDCLHAEVCALHAGLHELGNTAHHYYMGRSSEDIDAFLAEKCAQYLGHAPTDPEGEVQFAVGVFRSASDGWQFSHGPYPTQDEALLVVGGLGDHVLELGVDGIVTPLSRWDPARSSWYAM